MGISYIFKELVGGYEGSPSQEGRTHHRLMLNALQGKETHENVILSRISDLVQTLTSALHNKIARPLIHERNVLRFRYLRPHWRLANNSGCPM
jgi:hypothetical protein